MYFYSLYVDWKCLPLVFSQFPSVSSHVPIGPLFEPSIPSPPSIPPLSFDILSISIHFQVIGNVLRSFFSNIECFERQFRQFLPSSELALGHPLFFSSPPSLFPI